MRFEPLAGPVVEVKLVVPELLELIPAVYNVSMPAVPRIGKPPALPP